MRSARNSLITDSKSVLQLNRALPSGSRITDTSLVQRNLALARAGSKRRVTDTSLVQINRALEGIR